MQRNGSGGVVALEGGGPFVSNDELDRQLLTAAGIERIVMLPTADAFEQPTRLVAAAEAWAARIGIAVEPLMVITRADAEERQPAVTIDSAEAVFLAGD
jgi:cyanophycinase